METQDRENKGLESENLVRTGGDKIIDLCHIAGPNPCAYYLCAGGFARGKMGE